jgi:hypothetical protein
MIPLSMQVQAALLYPVCHSSIHKVKLRRRHRAGGRPTAEVRRMVRR